MNPEQPHPELIDIGANLTHDSFDSDRQAVIDAAQTVGVTTMIVSGSTVTDSVQAASLSHRYADVLYATSGVHPHHASEWDQHSAKAIYETAQLPGVVATGECGLDYYRNFSTPAQQAIAFEAQLEIAVELQQPAFLHQREALKPFLAILDKYLDKLPRAVAHCFTDTEYALDALLERDLYIGITGWICDERRGHHLQDLVARIPTNRLMIETDAPYLLPRDLRPKPKSRRNEPRHLPHIAQVVARCADKSLAQLAVETCATTRTFFALPQNDS